MPESEDALRTFAEPLLARVGDNAYLQALVAVVVALVLGKVVDIILCRGLGRLLKKTKTEVDDQILELIHGPIYITVVICGLFVALHRVAPGEQVLAACNGILSSLIVIVWFVFLLRSSQVLIRWLCDQTDRFSFVQPATVTLFDNLARVVLVLALVYALFLCWGIDVRGWLASAGIVGIAVGFAAKDTLANLFAGVFILADAPYKQGDFIILDGGERGRVTDIGIRSTRLLTRDDIEITIPNATIANAKIINETGGPWEKERIRITVQVAYGSDIDQVRSILMEVATRHESVCEEPEPRVRFREFGDSGLVLQLLCWIDEPVLRGRVQDALNTTIYKRFNELGIEIPYPKQDVYLRRVPVVDPEDRGDG